MELKSLGYRTDLIFPRFEGQVEDRDTYLVIRTPANPSFHWGNFLLFNHPPEPGDLERWKTLFAREIGGPPQFNHLTFGWDTTGGETGFVQPFLEAGFALEQTVVLTAAAVNPPPKGLADVEVRPLIGAAAWEEALALDITCFQGNYEPEGFAIFARAKFRRYRLMTEAGLGAWFGAYQNGVMAAACGLFCDGSLGRFQQVGTLPPFRRQGICGTLVYRASRFALEEMGVQTLVMLADENYHAAKIYESVGFNPTEKQRGVSWYLGIEQNEKQQPDASTS